MLRLLGGNKPGRLLADQVRQAEVARRRELHPPPEMPHDDVGRAQRPLHLRVDRVADLDVLEVARVRAAAGLGFVGGVDLGELLGGVGLGDLGLLLALLRCVALGVDPGAALDGVQLAALVGVDEVVRDVGRPAAEVAALVGRRRPASAGALRRSPSSSGRHHSNSITAWYEPSPANGSPFRIALFSGGVGFGEASSPIVYRNVGGAISPPQRVRCA